MEPRFTLRQIRYFLAAARAGSVNQAAFDVNISAPSISAAIGQIEEQYNIQLFVRHHSHGLLMTEDGKAFFAMAKAFYENAEQLESDAQGMGKTISSIVNAACFVTLAPVIIPLIASRFPAPGHPGHGLHRAAGRGGADRRQGCRGADDQRHKLDLRDQHAGAGSRRSAAERLHDG